MPTNKKGKAEKKTAGTVIADRVRSKANSFTDDKRQSLTERGMALIYSGPGYAKVADRH